MRYTLMYFSSVGFRFCLPHLKSALLRLLNMLHRWCWN